mgnify:CR=1 FL=1
MTATNTMTVLSTVTDIKVLDCLLALNLQVSIWSARKKLTPEDFSGVSALDLPPDDLASLGSKRVCDISHTQDSRGQSAGPARRPFPWRMGHP